MGLFRSVFSSKGASRPSWLVVGLGNPGSEYSGTRHNIGFVVLDELARRLGGGKKKGRYQSRLLLAGGLLLQWPRTYMNLSGQAVSSAMKAYGLSVDRLIVVHDDLDVSLGRIKVKRGGGAAGHKGVSSIIAETGSNAFVRVRCGIGRPPPGKDVADFVLSRFLPDDHDLIEEMVQRAADAVGEIVDRGVDAAMNRFNRTERGGAG